MPESRIYNANIIKKKNFSRIFLVKVAIRYSKKFLMLVYTMLVANFNVENSFELEGCIIATTV